jgi:hypothetical protein
MSDQDFLHSRNLGGVTNVTGNEDCKVSQMGLGSAHLNPLSSEEERGQGKGAAGTENTPLLP